MKFSERLLLLFGPPNSIDDEAFAREYERLLKGYQPDIIDAAIDQLARTHKYPGWPKIADCVAAAEDALEARSWAQRARNGGDRVDNDTMRRHATDARRFVNGPGGYGWEWAPAFRDHPWVILAEKEGWGRELRSACMRQAHLRFLGGTAKDGPTVENVMPDADTVAHWRKEAERTRSAAEWRKANPDHRAIKGQNFDITAFLEKNRKAYEASQATANRMTGERD